MGQSNEAMYEQEEAAAAAAAQESTYDFSDFPENIRVKTSENGGEVAMSLEETNRIREKLGMKPLRSGESERNKARRQAEEEGHLARLEAEKEKETKALAAKIAAAKERRLMESRNRSTKQLGEADDGDGVDDMTAWVQRSREIEEKRKKEEKRKAEELARKLAEQDEDDEEDESDDDDIFGGSNKRKSAGGYSAKELAGLKVRHGAEEVMEGETMILTLKDSSILDDARTGINEETDELENVQLAEEKRRKKARTGASKKSTTPFGAEEEEAAGKKLLSKYDEEEEEEALTLDGSGGVDEAERRRKEEIRRKLAASLGGAPVGAKEESAMVEKKGLADFMTAAEVAEAAAAKFNKPKKRRKKKLREKKIDAAELEADALAPESNELGSRRRREEEGGSAVAAAAAAERAEKDDRFARAVNKAKMKTDEKILAEMAGDLDEEMGAGGGEEEDDELERALARSRRLAARGTFRGEDAVVAAAGERREKDGPLAPRAAGEEGIVGLGGIGEGVVFSDMQEFIHGINIDDRRAAAGAGATTTATTTAAAAAAAAAAEPSGSEDGGGMPAVPPPPPPLPGRGEDMDVDDHDGMPPPPPPPPPPSSSVQDDHHQRSSNLGGIGEKSTASKGLAATLALLKDTGKLYENEMWDGRTNDKKPLALQRTKEATELSSGEWEGHKFDFRLDNFDEFGRKMTPKEAFRELCHRFHGIEPGKAKKEKRLKAYQEEVKAKKMREGDTPLNSMDKMKQVQQIQASPYVVLSGTIHAGQTSDPMSRYATMGMDQDDDEGGAGAGAGAGRAGAGKAGAGAGAGGKAAGGLGAAVNALPELRGKKKVKFMMKKR